MSTAGPEFTQTLTAQLFGASFQRRAFAVLAWVLASGAQAFAVTLVVGQRGEPQTRDLPREHAERAPAAPPQAAPLSGASIDEPARDGTNADETPWAGHADDLVDYAETGLVRVTELLRVRAARPFTGSLAR
ncbi:MAG: hypothetical protein JW940_36545 [Polyangiaceae bacterium]|nr:hypothetical protein [Polyangiaceae bacterium]